MLRSCVSIMAPANPRGTEKATTPMPMITLLVKPSISFLSRTSSPNHSKVKQCHGDTRGNAELLKAVMLIRMSGPKR